MSTFFNAVIVNGTLGQTMDLNIGMVGETVVRNKQDNQFRHGVTIVDTNLKKK